MEVVIKKRVLFLVTALLATRAFAVTSENLTWLNTTLPHPPHHFAVKFLLDQPECVSENGKENLFKRLEERLPRAFNDEIEWAKRVENEKLTVRIGNHDLKLVATKKGLGVYLMIDAVNQRSLYMERAEDFFSKLVNPAFRIELAAYCARMHYPDAENDFNEGSDLYSDLNKRAYDEWAELFMAFLRDDMFWAGFKEREIIYFLDELRG